MVCPACITGIILANAPGIAAAMGTAATVKLAVDKRVLSSMARMKPMEQKLRVVRVDKDRQPRPMPVVQKDQQ
jgi:hypothetical protein